jgi:hypothetical protein
VSCRCGGCGDEARFGAADVSGVYDTRFDAARAGWVVQHRDAPARLMFIGPTQGCVKIAQHGRHIWVDEREVVIPPGVWPAETTPRDPRNHEKQPKRPQKRQKGPKTAKNG